MDIKLDKTDFFTYICYIKQEENYKNITNSLGEALYQYIRKMSQSVYQNPVVCKLKNSIYANIGDVDFDLTQKIADTGFNPDYVRRCFKRETGKIEPGNRLSRKYNQ